MGRTELSGVRSAKKFYYTADANQYLLAYQPSGGTFPKRICIFVHGGGWQNGGPGMSPSEAPWGLLAKDIMIFSLHHRNPASWVWPKQINDISSAVRWVKANASKFGADKAKVCLWGYSSGSHLSVLAALSQGQAALIDGSMGNISESQNVQLCVGWATPQSFPLNDADLITNGFAARTCFTTSAEAELLGGIGTGINPCSGGGIPLSTEANPSTYVALKTTKFRIEHGSLDNIIAWQRGKALHDSLVAAGNDSTWVQHAALTHVTLYSDATVKTNTINWIDANL